MVAYVHFENESICYLCEGYLSHDLFKKLDLRTISWNVFRQSPGRINIKFTGFAAFAVRLGGEKLNSKNARKVFINVFDYWKLS